MGYYYNMIGYVEVSEADAQRFLDELDETKLHEISEYRKSTGYEVIHECTYHEVFIWKEQGKWYVGVPLITMKDSEGVNIHGLNSDINHAIKSLNEFCLNETIVDKTNFMLKYASQDGLFIES